METRNKQESQYARSLIEASLDPLVTINIKGKITDMNQATVNITGIDREKLIGSDFFDYFTEQQKAARFTRKCSPKVVLPILRLHYVIKMAS
jgi:PAS domain S-box-containing protein